MLRCEKRFFFWLEIFGLDGICSHLLFNNSIIMCVERIGNCLEIRCLINFFDGWTFTTWWFWTTGTMMTGTSRTSRCITTYDEKKGLVEPFFKKKKLFDRLTIKFGHDGWANLFDLFQFVLEFFFLSQLKRKVKINHYHRTINDR